jgi:hypothetical protein
MIQNWHDSKFNASVGVFVRHLDFLESRFAITVNQDSKAFLKQVFPLNFRFGLWFWAWAIIHTNRTGCFKKSLSSYE